MGNIFTFDAVLKRIFVLFLASIILMNFQGFWRLAYADDTRNVHGRFTLSDGKSPIAGALVKIWESNWFFWPDYDLGETHTDDNGYYQVTVDTGSPEDIFAKCYAENDAVDVKSSIFLPPFFWGHTIRFRTDNFDRDSNDVDLGAKSCDPDEDAGFKIMMAITEGWKFVQSHAGYTIPKVRAFDNDIVAKMASAPFYYNGAFTNPITSPYVLAIAMAQLGWFWDICIVIADMFLGVTGLPSAVSEASVGIHIKAGYESRANILHEYGHYVMDQLGDFWPPFSYMAHSPSETIDVETAWVEGWADFFSAAARNSPITNSFQGEACEGAVSGALSDMYFQGSMTFGEMLNVIENYDPHTGWDFFHHVPFLADHPWEIQEFWDGCLVRLASISRGSINSAWKALNQHGISEPDNDDPHSPTGYRASEDPWTVSPAPPQTVTVRWSGAFDDTSGIGGWSICWDGQPVTLPPETVNLNYVPDTRRPWVQGSNTSFVLTGDQDWYFHVRTKDNSGRWSLDALNIGPFMRKGLIPTYSNIRALPDRDPNVVCDNETDPQIAFSLRWSAQMGEISQVKFTLWADSVLIGDFDPTYTLVPSEGVVESVLNLADVQEGFADPLDWKQFPWTSCVGHTLYWTSTAWSAYDPAHPIVTPKQLGPSIVDDDVAGPEFQSPLSDGNKWDNDTTWNYYKVGIRVYSPRGISTIQFRSRVGQGDWSDWIQYTKPSGQSNIELPPPIPFPYIPHPPSDPQIPGETAVYYIPRSEIMTPTTTPGDAIYFQVKAMDNDTDFGDADKTEKISPAYVAGYIEDNEEDPPKLVNPSVEYVTLQGSHNQAIRAKIYAIDPSGISSVKFKARIDTEDGWPVDYATPWQEPSGENIELFIIPSGKWTGRGVLLHSYWFDPPFPLDSSNSKSIVGKRFYWQVYARDADNDVAEDEAEGYSDEFVYHYLAPPSDHPTLNLVAKGNWITCQAGLRGIATSKLGAGDIDASTIMLNHTFPICLGAADYDNNGALNLTFDLNRTLVSEWILSSGVKYGNVTLTVTGKLEDGTQFEGNVVIKVRMPGDLNSDGKVDVRDVSPVGAAFGSYPGHPRWNTDADQNEDGKIDLKDVALTVKNFGKKYA